jgi:LuxR family maltose regulon positive regulatory protein
MANLIPNLSTPMLLSAKLNRPRLKANLILRQALITRLTKGLSGNIRLFLLSAPPGYGKTTLVCQWLNNTAVRHTWFSLDEKDNNPVRFLTYLLAAIRKIIPEAGRTTQYLLGLAKLPPVDVLITPLINDLAGLKERLVLIFDDYHLICNRYIHNIIQFILDYRPPLLHLVLITREAPPLAIARMRAGEVISELKDNDFLFSEAETAAFMAGTMRLNIKNEAITLLNLLTEGWVAGLQLAAFAMQGCTQENIDDFVLDFSRSNHCIIDYLISKVLAKLTVEVRDFLKKTAVLNLLCAPLCHALTGRRDNQKFLELLARNNFFLYPLDDHRQWYRYHHIIVDSIRLELDLEERRVIYQKAVRWYETNGYSEEAIADFPKAEHSGYPANSNDFHVPIDDKQTVAIIPPDIPAIRSKPGTELRAAAIGTLTIPRPNLDTPSFANLLIPLSNRERELLRLIVNGFSNREIARKLYISLSTTKCHIHNIFQKLGVNNRTQAAIKAKQLNLA